MSGVVSVPVAAAICARLGLERRTCLDHRGTQLRQHVPEHRVAFYFQVIAANLHRHMPIAEVVGGLRQRTSGGRTYDIDALDGGNDPHDAAIASSKSIAVAQHRPALEKQACLFAAIETYQQAAAPAQLERQREHRVCHPRVAVVVQQAIEPQHRDQNRKYRCVIGSVAAGSHHSD